MELNTQTFFDINKGTSNENFRILYEILNQKIKFNISQTIPGGYLSEFRSYLNRDFDEFDLKKIENWKKLKYIYAAIHSLNSLNKYRNSTFIEEIKKTYEENKDKPEINNNYNLLIFLSKITGENYISGEDIIKFCKDILSLKDVQENQKAKKEKIVYGTMGEWLSVILYNKIKNKNKGESIFTKNNNLYNKLCKKIDEKYFIYVIERDIFNGIFDYKSVLFLNMNFEKYKDDQKLYRIIYKFLKFTLGNELHLKKQYKKELSTIFKQIIEKEKNEIKNYNNFMDIKENYEHFMNSLFDIIKKNYQSLFLETKDKRQIQICFGNEKIKVNIELNSFEYSVLIENFYADYNFYNKLIFLLLFLCNNVTYPMITIVNSFILLSDLIHLNKCNVHLGDLLYYLIIIKDNINNLGFKSKIFDIPILQLKILTSLHDIWDLLIENNIPYYDYRFYLIKNIFNSFNQDLFKGYLKKSSSMNYLYYSFIFKKGIRKLTYNRNIIRAMKYFEIVSNNIKDEFLMKKAKKCLEYCQIKAGM